MTKWHLSIYLFQKVIQGNEEQTNKLTEEDIRMILSLGE